MNFFWKILETFMNLINVMIALYRPSSPAIIPPIVAGTDRPAENGQKSLICPFAKQDHKHTSEGKYSSGYPVGAVVHYTAGQCDSEQDAIDSIDWGRGENYTFWMISPMGAIYQTVPLDEWGSHCGTSSWPDLGSSLSNQLVGIEMACAGLLDEKGKSWFGKTYPDTRTVTNAEHHCDSGVYKKYTQAQEESLFRLLKWLHENNPSVFSYDHVLGHHEISPGRKSDPGGSLSTSMADLRARLKG